MSEHTEERPGPEKDMRPEALPEADPNLFGRRPVVPKPWGEWIRYVTIIAAGMVIGLGAIAAIEELARIFAVIFLGITIASALSPIVNRLTRGPIPRAVVVVLIYAILVLALVVVGLVTIPLLVTQMEDLIDSAPEALDAVEAWVSEQRWLRDLLDQQDVEQLIPLDSILSALAGLGGLLALPVTIIRFIAEALLMVFVSIYWLILANDMSAFVGSLFPAAQSERILAVLRRMGRAVGGYFVGVLIDGAVVATVNYAGLALIGVPYPLILGVIAGLGEIVPVVGPFAAGAVILTVALFQSPQTALLALIFILIMQQLESNVLVPIVMKSQVHISPLLTLLAVTLGGTIGGLLGGLVALPLAAALSTLVRVAIAPAIRRRTGAEPQEVD